MAKNKKKPKLPKTSKQKKGAFRWLTNAIKSITREVPQLFIDELPETSEMVSDFNEKFFSGGDISETYNAFKTASVYLKRRIWDDTVKKTTSTAWKDIKEGHIGGRKENFDDDFGGFDMGDDDDFSYGDDDDDDFSYDDGDDDDFSYDDGDDDVGSKKSGGSVNNTYNMISSNNKESSKAASTSGIKMQAGISLMLGRNLINAVHLIHRDLEIMYQFQTSETKSFYDASKEYYSASLESAKTIATSLEELKELAVYQAQYTGLNSYIEEEKRKNKFGETKSFEESIMDSLKEWLGPDSMLGTAMQAIAHNPLKELSKIALRKIIFNKQRKAQMEELDFSLTGLIDFIGGQSDWEYSDSFIKKGLYHLIGKHKQPTSYRGMEKEKYRAERKLGPVPFDGVTKSAITETIPSLLSKTVNVLEHIYHEGLPTWRVKKPGKREIDHKKELIFDYDTGVFDSKDSILKRQHKEIKQRIFSDVSSYGESDGVRKIIGDFKTRVGFSTMTKKEQDEVEGFIATIFIYFARNTEEQLTQFTRMSKENIADGSIPSYMNFIIQREPDLNPELLYNFLLTLMLALPKQIRELNKAIRVHTVDWNEFTQNIYDKRSTDVRSANEFKDVKLYQDAIIKKIKTEKEFKFEDKKKEYLEKNKNTAEKLEKDIKDDTEKLQKKMEKLLKEQYRQTNKDTSGFDESFKSYLEGPEWKKMTDAIREQHQRKLDDDIIKDVYPLKGIFHSYERTKNLATATNTKEVLEYLEEETKRVDSNKGYSQKLNELLDDDFRKRKLSSSRMKDAEGIIGRPIGKIVDGIDKFMYSSEMIDDYEDKIIKKILKFLRIKTDDKKEALDDLKGVKNTVTEAITGKKVKEPDKKTPPKETDKQKATRLANEKKFGIPPSGEEPDPTESPKPFAVGGKVRGGKKGVDSVRANLTPGEFIVKEEVVSRIGSDKLDKLNTGQAGISTLKKDRDHDSLDESNTTVAANMDKFNSILNNFIDFFDKSSEKGSKSENPFFRIMGKSYKNYRDKLYEKTAIKKFADYEKDGKTIGEFLKDYGATNLTEAGKVIASIDRETNIAKGRTKLNKTLNKGMDYADRIKKQMSGVEKVSGAKLEDYIDRGTQEFKKAQEQNPDLTVQEFLEQVNAKDLGELGKRLSKDEPRRIPKPVSKVLDTANKHLENYALKMYRDESSSEEITMTEWLTQLGVKNFKDAGKLLLTNRIKAGVSDVARQFSSGQVWEGIKTGAKHIKGIYRDITTGRREASYTPSDSIDPDLEEGSDEFKPGQIREGEIIDGQVYIDGKRVGPEQEEETSDEDTDGKTEKEKRKERNKALRQKSSDVVEKSLKTSGKLLKKGIKAGGKGLLKIGQGFKKFLGGSASASIGQALKGLIGKIASITGGALNITAGAIGGIAKAAAPALASAASAVGAAIMNPVGLSILGGAAVAGAAVYGVHRYNKIELFKKVYEAEQNNDQANVNELTKDWNEKKWDEYGKWKYNTYQREKVDNRKSWWKRTLGIGKTEEDKEFKKLYDNINSGSPELKENAEEIMLTWTEEKLKRFEKYTKKRNKKNNSYATKDIHGNIDMSLVSNSGTILEKQFRNDKFERLKNLLLTGAVEEVENVVRLMSNDELKAFKNYLGRQKLDDNTKKLIMKTIPKAKNDVNEVDMKEFKDKLTVFEEMFATLEELKSLGADEKEIQNLLEKDYSYIVKNEALWRDYKKYHDKRKIVDSKDELLKKYKKHFIEDITFGDDYYQTRDDGKQLIGRKAKEDVEILIEKLFGHLTFSPKDDSKRVAAAQVVADWITRNTISNPTNREELTNYAAAFINKTLSGNIRAVKQDYSNIAESTHVELSKIVSDANSDELLSKPAENRAMGGLVTGRSGSDAVRANLTSGEYVIRKPVVDKVGKEKLDKLNTGGFQDAIVKENENFVFLRYLEKLTLLDNIYEVLTSINKNTLGGIGKEFTAALEQVTKTQNIINKKVAENIKEIKNKDTTPSPTMFSSTKKPLLNPV